jgi:hypothetical protein
MVKRKFFVCVLRNFNWPNQGLIFLTYIRKMSNDKTKPQIKLFNAKWDMRKDRLENVGFTIGSNIKWQFNDSVSSSYLDDTLYWVTI